MATQGAYLAPLPGTPLCRNLGCDEFANKLDFKLKVYVRSQDYRRLNYGVEIADEWPGGRTPPEHREKYRAKKTENRERCEADLAVEEAELEAEVKAKRGNITPSDFGDGYSDEIHGRVDPEKSPGPPPLPTPCPSSVEPYSPKCAAPRSLLSVRDYPPATTPTDAIHEANKSRKRRRAFDDGGEDGERRPPNTRTTAKPGRRWRVARPPRVAG